MSEKTNVTKEAEVIEDVETEVSGGRDENKMVVKALFLGAVKSEKSGKIGITFLIYDNMDEKGQLQVSSSSRVIAKQQITQWPIIQAWSKTKDDDPKGYAEFEKYLTYGGLRDVRIVISGKAGFEKFHGELSKQEFDMYVKLLSKF